MTSQIYNYLMVACWRYNTVPSHLYTCWLQTSTTGYSWHLHLDHQQLAKFNSTKCKYMIIYRKRPPSLCQLITLDNLPMKHVQSYRYLGVWLISSLSWSVQVDTITTLSCICPTSPRLFWDPHQQGHINSLEQETFALKVCNKKWNMDYDSLLNSFKLPTLVSRRYS